MQGLFSRVMSSPSSANGEVRGFRFRGYGKMVPWREDLNSVSPYFGAMARKVKAPEGSSVEMDESGYILVDDSSYGPKAIDVVMAAMKRERLDLSKLNASEVLESMKCADFFQLSEAAIQEVVTSLWTKMKAKPAADANAELRFTGLRFTEPMACGSFAIESYSVSELLLTNLAVRDTVSFTDMSMIDSNFFVGLGGELMATNAVLTKCNLKTLCSKATVRASKLAECTWIGHPGHLETLVIENSELTNCSLGGVGKLELKDTTMSSSTLSEIEKLSLVNSSLSANTLPSKIKVLELQGFVTRADFQASDQMRLGAVDGTTCLRECRLRLAPGGSTFNMTGPLSASGCIFSGLTFVVDAVPLSFKACIFHKCVFKVLAADRGRCVVMDDCTLVEVRTQVRAGQRWADQHTQVGPIRTALQKHFMTPCQVLADLTELPDHVAESHRQWLAAVVAVQGA